MGHHPPMRLLLSFAALLGAAGCASSPTMRPPAFDEATARAAVDRELDDLHDAAARADERRYFDHFAPEGVFLGTDVTERWTVPAFRAYAHPHFSKGQGWTYHPLRRVIAFAPAGDLAWFDEDLRGERIGPTRGAGVLVHRGGRWLVTLYDLSITVPNERFDAVKAVLDQK
jgi:hypothetical protein